jgi:hypothetical protein
MQFRGNFVVAKPRLKFPALFAVDAPHAEPAAAPPSRAGLCRRLHRSGGWGCGGPRLPSRRPAGAGGGAAAAQAADGGGRGAARSPGDAPHGAHAVPGATPFAVAYAVANVENWRCSLCTESDILHLSDHDFKKPK